MKLKVYEAPAAKAMAVKIERMTLSARVSSTRKSYGAANHGGMGRKPLQ